MNYANIKYNDIANGQGVRTSLFVSGCTHHCKECFQPETWNFDFGHEFTPEIADKIIKSVNMPYISGLTILGGEPFEPQNRKVLLPFLKEVRSRCPGKSIWSYSGYTYEQLTAQEECRCGNASDMLALLDVLVDGEFQIEKKDISLKFRGSSNQRIVDLNKTKQIHELMLYEL